MRKIALMICLALVGCTPHYYGLGIAKTEMETKSYKTMYYHRSFGIGVFSVPEIPYSQFACGYMATRISVYDPLLEMKEWALVRDLPKQ